MRRGIEPSVTPSGPLPSLLHPPTHPPAVALSVALEELWLSEKNPTLTTHFNRCAHSQAGIKAGKISCHRVLLLSGAEMPPEQGFDHEGTLKLSPETHGGEIF